MQAILNTPIEVTGKAARLEITAGEAVNILRVLQPFTDLDSRLPAGQCIRFAIHDGVLRAEAGDGFMAFMLAFQPKGASSGSAEAVVLRRDVDTMLQGLRVLSKHSFMRFRIAKNKFFMESQDGKHIVSELECQKVKWPDYQSLTPGTGRKGQPWGVDPAKLEKVMRAFRYLGMLVRVYNGGVGAVVRMDGTVSNALGARALLMPMSMSNDQA